MNRKRNLRQIAIRIGVVQGLCAAAGFAEGVEFREVPLGVEKGNYAAVAMGDLDGDGFAELLSGRREGEEGLYVFARGKSGKPWSRHELSAEGVYGGVALADITGEGVPDPAAVRTDGRVKGLQLFASRRGEKGLRFEELDSPFTEVACDDLAAGDVEADGDIDLAVSTGGKGLQIFVNEGKAASWGRVMCETMIYEDTGIALGDANGDGRLDVIAANHPGENPRLFLCTNADPLEYDAGHNEGLTIGPGIGYKMTFADFDGNGHADLAFGTEGGLRLFMGNGCDGPASGWWTEAQVSGSGGQTIQVSAGDWDGDGRPDLAFATDRGIALRLNEGGGKFSERLAAGLPEKGEFSGCVGFDWDGDGDLDLACSSMQGLGIRLFENLKR